MARRWSVAVVAVVVFVAARAAAEPGRVVGTLAITEADGRPAVGADAVVYVVGFTEAPSSAGAIGATIRQQGRRFVPELEAITAGEKVAFPNGDPFFHNVYSESAARPFDLGSYRKGESKDKDFPRAGVVDVYCNIHAEMAATILIIPNRRHARVGADGRFAIEGVPAGTWTLFAFTRRAVKPVSARVVVPAGGAANVELAIVRGAEPPHLNKYGEKYRDGTSYR
jgi:plastocyanin